MPSTPDSAPPAAGQGDPAGGAAGLVLSLAGDLAEQDCALDAELLLSTLLGAVYAVTGADRGRIQSQFTTRLAGQARAAGTPTGTTMAALLRAWEPPAGREEPAAGDGSHGTAAPDGTPAWLAHAGRVRVTGAWAYGDRYGDQTGYVVTFAYDDERLGGPEHAVLILADHNAGMAVDVLVTAPAEEMVRGLREAVAADPDRMSWFTATAPATVRAAATAYLRLTDLAADLPENDSLSANRALALARIALLPSGAGGSGDATPAAADPAADAADDLPDDPAAPADTGSGAAPGQGAPEGLDGARDPVAAGPETPHSRVVADATTRSRLVREFLDSPEADVAGLADTGPAAESVRYCADLIVDFAAAARAGDPLRWSPTAVSSFLLDWVHTRAVLDREDVATLPRVVSAWVLWAGHRLGIPDAAVRRTLDACRAQRAEFERLCASGERQSEAARAVAEMVAAGLNPDDPAQVVAWLDDQQGAG